MKEQQTAPRSINMDIEKLRNHIIKNSVIFEQEYHPNAYSELELNAKLTKLDIKKIYDAYDLMDEDKNESLNRQYDNYKRKKSKKKRLKKRIKKNDEIR
ncbi:TPA: hypothetical protein NIU78_005095 [Klebsiella pneumoniae]|nr:hypothetical protein [Klebsiella pneumoniae]